MKLSSVQRRSLQRSAHPTQQGFTLTEVLVVIIIAGVLAGIAAPSWLAFVDRQRMTTVRSELLLMIKEAQAKALRTKTTQSIVITNPAPGVTLPTVSVVQSSVAGGTVTTSGDNSNKKTLGGESNRAFILETFPANATLTFNYGGTVASPTTTIGAVAGVALADNQNALMMYRFKPRASSVNMSACIVVDTIIGAIREVTDDQCK